MALVAVVTLVLVLGSVAFGVASRSSDTAQDARGDLAVSTVASSSDSLHPGASFTSVLRLRNTAGGLVGRSQVKLLLSTDRQTDRRDLLLAKSSGRRLRGGASRRLRITAAIPQQVKPGGYWLIACATTKSPEVNRRNNCGVGKSRLTVTILGPPSKSSPNFSNSPPVPSPPLPSGPDVAPVSVKVGSCEPTLAVGALGSTPSVIEGEEVSYSASVRNDPTGACLEVAGTQTVAGTVEVTASISDVAMWIEVTDGSLHDVLPSAAGLTTSGAAAPGGCPGGELAGCEASIQNVVGNVFYPADKARTLAAGEKAEIPFRFFPTLGQEDLERIATASPGGIRLVVAVEMENGSVALARTSIVFSAAGTLAGVQLEVTLPDGDAQASGIGPVTPGGQVDVEPAASYFTSSEDPDSITASFRARSDAPGELVSSPVSVSTVITNDPAARPRVFPTASPSAATVGTTPTVLIAAALQGTVEGSPSVVLEGSETELGALHDDGEEGDLVAADGIWSGQVQVPLAETRVLRVDVQLDGSSQSGAVEVEALPAGAPVDAATTSSLGTIVTGSGETVLRDRIILRMAADSAYSLVLAAADQVSGAVAGRIAPDTWQIAIPPVADEAALNLVLADVSTAAGVIGAEAETVFETTDVLPNDPLYASQSHLPQVDANRAWIAARGSSPRVVVAVIDSGVDRDHPDLASRLLAGRDLANGDSSPEDTCGHGTHVAGIVGAATNNAKAVAGVNWNAALLPVKVFPDVSNPAKCGGAVNLSAAIRWAVDRGASVINLSLGGPGRSEAIVEALDYAWNAGRVVVAAAGNNGSSSKSYPAGYERTEEFSSLFGLFKRTYRTDVIAVGNVLGNDVRAASSNYGGWVDIAAPGSGVLSTYLNGGTKSLSGTSMASPVVAGVASLMLSNGVAGPERIRNLLINSGKPISQGVGPRVNAFEAVFNGSFEAGLDTWARTGTVSTISRLGPIFPRSGSRMLSLSTGPAGDQISATVRKAGQIPNSALRNGKATLSLQYNYVTEEYPEYVGSQFNDTLGIVAKLPNGESLLMADESVNATNWTPVSGIDFPGGDGTVGQSGWKTASLTVPASALGGPGELTIVVSDVGDAIYDSVGLVDAVRLD
ncbi:MAG: S8 family serine peptidase [Solirubrobacterales bacterium]